MKKKYHAHIYFILEQQFFAEKLRHEIEKRFSIKIGIGKLYLSAIGPHPMPMFAVYFSEVMKREVVSFLICHRGNLNILIHEDTGDDYYDHTIGAEWLGQSVNIDFNYFERIKNEENIRILFE